MTKTSWMIRTTAALFVLTAAPFAAMAADEHYLSKGIAINGYDAVAYHTAGAPTKGSADFKSKYQGVTWKFSSAENRDLFAAEPAKFAPAYGGWCAVGASKGKKLATLPDQWKVVDGQLFLNSSEGAQAAFTKDTATVISKGETNWSRMFATEADKL